MTLDEIAGCVRRLFAETFGVNAILPVSEESDELAQAYWEGGVVSEKYFGDAQHVAVCSMARIEYLASWNFRHLANAGRENAFHAVDRLRGYREVRIVSPKSLIYGFEEEI